ncbi:MAG: MipA/OmpV family protein [Francisellaceae bacterium]
MPSLKCHVKIFAFLGLSLSQIAIAAEKTDTPGSDVLTSTQVQQENTPKNIEKENVMKMLDEEAALRWSIGAGAIFSPNPYKQTSDTILPLPIIGYNGERLKINGPSASYIVVGNKNINTAVEAFLYPEYFRASKSDDESLKKLDNRHYIVVAGLSQRFNTPYGRLRFGLDFDITGQSNGYLFQAGYTKPFPIPMENELLILSPGFGVQYSSEKLMDYYYGISSGEAASSGLSAYSPSGAWSPYVSFRLSYRYKTHWNLFASTRVSRLSNQAYDSPMVSSRYIVSAMAGVSYAFA